MAGAKCQESQSKVEKSVNSIKSSEEYSEFVERNKTSPPKPVLFKFESSLLDLATASKLRPNEIAVDEFTVDVLRQKLKENEQELKETKNRIKEKQTLVIQHDTEFQTVQFKSDPISISRKYAFKKTMDILKKEINELRCVEQKVGRQTELISGSLLSDVGNDVGASVAATHAGNSSPAGCDTSGGSSYNNNQEPGGGLLALPDADGQSQSSNGKKKSTTQVMHILRKPFARKTESPVR
jgi:hypothetical protein